MKALKVLFSALAIGAYLVVLTGCNTVEGAGEDIEAGGEAISDTSRDVRD